MEYYDGDTASMESVTPQSVTRLVTSVVVRLAGVALVFIGLWAGATVIYEAWSLYKDPTRIEGFAETIEKASNLDKIFGFDWAPRAAAGPEGGTPGGELVQDTGLSPSTSAAENPDAPAESLKLSYFAAWFIVPLLLWVIGSLAMHAVTTGGQLALHETQARGVSRAIVKELKRYQRAA